MLVPLALVRCGRINDGDDDYDQAGSDNDGPGREVLVTRPQPPVRVETQTVTPRTGICLHDWLLDIDRN